MESTGSWVPEGPSTSNTPFFQRWLYQVRDRSTGFRTPSPTTVETVSCVRTSVPEYLGSPGPVREKER